MADINKDISDFLACMLGLGGLYAISDDDKKYVLIKHEDNTYGQLFQDETPVSIYGTSDGSSFIINPFAEGNITEEQGTFFYKTVNNMFAAVLIKTMKHIINRVLAMQPKNAKNYKAMEGDSRVSDYTGILGNKITKGTLAEFKGIIGERSGKNPMDFFNLYLNKRKGEMVVHCAVFNKSVREQHTNVSQNTWNLLEYMVTKLLKTDNEFSDLVWHVENGNIARIEAYANMLAELWGRLAPAAKLIGVDVAASVKALRSHLPNLEAYYNKAKWCSSPINNPNPGIKVTQAPVQPGVNLPPAVLNNMNQQAQFVQPATVGMNSNLPPVIQNNLNYHW